MIDFGYLTEPDDLTVLAGAIHTIDGYPYDYHRVLHTFRVKSRTKDVGIYRPKHAWQFSEAMTFTRIGAPDEP